MSYLRPMEILEPIKLHYLIESREDSYAYLISLLFGKLLWKRIFIAIGLGKGFDDLLKKDPF